MSNSVQRKERLSVIISYINKLHYSLYLLILQVYFCIDPPSTSLYFRNRCILRVEQPTATAYVTIMTTVVCIVRWIELTARPRPLNIIARRPNYLQHLHQKERRHAIFAGNIITTPRTVSSELYRFYRATLYERDILSSCVRLSVRPSQACTPIVSKRQNLGSSNQRHRIAQGR